MMTSSTFYKNTGGVNLIENFRQKTNDFPNIHIRSDKNRSSNFGDDLSNKNRQSRRTDRHTDRSKREINFFRDHETFKKHENNHSSNGLYYNTSLA